jgi:serine/threonine protein kinase
MVNEKGLVEILDFGLAKLTDPAEGGEFGTTQTMRPATEEGTIVGTLAYLSPEQAEGKKVDSRSDVFSFGSVFRGAGVPRSDEDLDAIRDSAPGAEAAQ